MATSVTERNYIDQFVNAEWDQGYTRIQGIFKNDTGAEASFQPGLIVEFATPNYIPLTTEANAAGFLLTKITDLADDGTIAAAFLLRGPAVINDDAIDYNSVSTPADAKTALEVLSPPFVFADESTNIQSGVGN